MKTKKKSSRSLMLEKILDWFGFRLKLARNFWEPGKKWQLVWTKKINDCTVFFVRHYDAAPFRRYESRFSLEKTKPKKSFNSCFAEFLGSVEMFELEYGEEAEVDITSYDGWLKNPLFGCKSLEEMVVKLDLLGARRQ